VTSGWVFYIAGAIAIGSAGAMIFMRNGVHSALMLVLNLMALAVLFAQLEATFLFVVQLIVYAGAIMVLFLFVIMLLGVERNEDLRETLPGQTVAGGVLAVVAAGGLIWVLRLGFGSAKFQSLAPANRSGNVQALGRLLFQHYAFPFEFTSVLLIVAAIAAMVLGRSREEEESASEILEHTYDGALPPAGDGETRTPHMTETR
jgi:NADH-quinone oxidoreductase subunit J